MERPPPYVTVIELSRTCPPVSCIVYVLLEAVGVIVTVLPSEVAPPPSTELTNAVVYSPPEVVATIFVIAPGALIMISELL